MSTRRKTIIGIAGIVILSILGMLFYSFYYVKTPEYTLKIIEKSYKTHNVEEFHKHVDVDSVISLYIDDAIAKDAELKNNPFAMLFIPLIKSQVIPIVKENLNKAIRGDEVSSNSLNMTFQPINQIEHLKDKVTVTSISASTKDNIATITAKLAEKETGKEYDVNMKASKLDDGTWKIYEVTNMYDVLVGLQKISR